MRRSIQLGLVTLALAFVFSFTMVRTAPGSSTLLLLFTLAFSYLFFPKVMQSLALRAVRMGITSRCRSLVAFVGSKQYLTAVRAVGLFAGGAAMFLLIESYNG
jgi:hypothetical protein